MATTTAKKIGRPIEPDARRIRMTMMLREDELEMIRHAAADESMPPAIFARHEVLLAARAVLSE